MHETVKGLFGMGATNGAVAIAQAMGPEARSVQVLQVISLSVGILVGVLTAISITLTIYWKITNKKGAKDE